MASEDRSGTELGATRMSRYRSQRQQNPLQRSAPPPVPMYSPSDPVISDTIQRSRSRYRRAKPAVSGPPIPDIATGLARAQSAGMDPVHPQINGSHVPRSGPLPDASTNAASRPLPVPSGFPITGKPSITPTAPSSRILADARPAGPDAQAKAEARHIIEAEAERQRKMRLKIKADGERARARKEMEREKLDQHQPDIRVPHRADERAGEARPTNVSPDDAQRGQRESHTNKNRLLHHLQGVGNPRDQNVGFGYVAGSNESARGNSAPQARLQLSPSKELLGFMKRMRPNDPSRPATGTEARANSRDGLKSHQKPQTPTGALGPGIDAPISAVNAGERRVLVSVERSSIYLPVTPTTTPVDLIHGASTGLQELVNIDASVLLEGFGKVGVQRPLRTYEHVRNVLNSWDDDQQNCLILVPALKSGNDIGLDASSVPAEQPSEFTCQMYYSQKPGKWDKKWMTLRSDGQITVAKEQGAKEADQFNVCHMTDFDIYSASPKQISQKIKPPKKICFAIKSQQKSAMFLSMDNFVHFFCCSDKKMAAAFYRAVQGWRSWYLVHVLGEGQKVRDKDGVVATSDAVPKRRASVKGAGMTRRPSLHPRKDSKSNSYQPGSSKPLLDINTSNSESSKIPLTTTLPHRTPTSAHTRQTSPRVCNPPSAYRTRPPTNPTSPQDRSSSEHERNTRPLLRNDDDKTFAPTGLLGRTYTHRQRALEAKDYGLSKPFASSRNAAGNSATNNTTTDLKRNSSSAARRALHQPQSPGKPLIDLAETQERPSTQHSSKGRGFDTRASISASNGRLIDRAGNADDTLSAPPSR